MTSNPLPINVLIIDDDTVILHIIKNLLISHGYNVNTANNGARGIDSLKTFTPDIVLCDLEMPVMNGFEVISHLKENYPHLPIVVVSGQINVDDAMKAIRLGAWDYISKPVQNIDIILHTIKNSLEKARLIRENEEYKINLEIRIKQRTDELKKANKQLQEVIFSTVKALSILTEKRDPYTAGHQERVAKLAILLAQEMGFDKHTIDGMRIAGLLHDIGKICVPSEFLTKPSRLEKNEFEIIKKHSAVGYEILCSVPFPWPVADIVHQHHEWIDGTGYPQGLKGDEILPEAKLISLADAIEAMVSHRPYRPAMGMQFALSEIRKWQGKHFTYESVAVFENLYNSKSDKLREILNFL